MSYALGFDTLTFSQRLSEILESDYGDFMRAANVYLNHLRAQLCALNDKNLNQRLDQMQMCLQFCPNWDVESTRELLRKDTVYLDDLLHGHNQDWESPTASFNFLKTNV
jgi:hypothetical protein